MPVVMQYACFSFIDGREAIQLASNYIHVIYELI